MSEKVLYLPLCDSMNMQIEYWVNAKRPFGVTLYYIHLFLIDIMTNVGIKGHETLGKIGTHTTKRRERHNNRANIDKT